MIMTRRLIQCRVELKYLLRSHQVVRFLASLGAALSRPGFRRDQGRLTTVYFDRPDGFLARGVLARPERSLKLRLREYFTPEGVASSPFVWIEIKERLGVTSRKDRFRLHKRFVTRFLRGDLSEREVLTCQDRSIEPCKVVEAVRRLREVAAEGELVPAGAVAYRRLALEGGEPEARLTLDQDISYHLGPFDLYDANPALAPETLGPAALEEGAAIVELKYRDVMPPAWCERALGQARPIAYSKFQVLSALALSEEMVD